MTNDTTRHMSTLGLVTFYTVAVILAALLLLAFFFPARCGEVLNITTIPAPPW